MKLLDSATTIKSSKGIIMGRYNNAYLDSSTNIVACTPAKVYTITTMFS